MFAKKKDYKQLAQDVKTHHFALFGNDCRASGIVTRLSNKIDYKDLNNVKDQLLARIEQLEDLLIKAGILVEVQEPETDFARKESDQHIESKLVRYAVKKIK